MNLGAKLSILADAAKYDASCASSGTSRRDSRAGGIGSTTGSGICHSYTPDGRCVSLLKILLTNFCVYDCLYCINRRSSNVRRARFTIDEVVNLTIDFYRRNYIEGLFLSSGIIHNPDYTMERVVEVARKLRAEHGFKGYIHLKTIPEASSELIDQAGLWADRISINVELPTETDLSVLAPEKNLSRIEKAMAHIRGRIDSVKAEKKSKGRAFAPAGQSTQMIVGATSTPDVDILVRATNLYLTKSLKRVYYSAFSPIPDASARLPVLRPPLVREHRLYQADWLIRFYNYKAEELVNSSRPNLDLNIDPKLYWALSNPDHFPVDINSAPREILLRVPGLGVRNVNRLLVIRRWKRIGMLDLKRLGISLKKVSPFLITLDHLPPRSERFESLLNNREKSLQQELFDDWPGKSDNGTKFPYAG
ncbi:MAG: putative DNA modification/repair radical SAM protein [Verrucomicrobia bacterium]|nr:putative DNA modification/repair radical SAM protein [Verrucomicrobiota bacterium]MBV9672204.1 putative DNA modification/repair radical SAM protein [Verrucomicrobiota bacterium]